MEFLFLLAGLIIGFALGWLILKSKYSSVVSSVEAENMRNRLSQLESEKIRSEERENGFKQSFLKSSEDLVKERAKVEELLSSVSRLEETNNNLKERFSEQKGEIEELQQKFTKEFENLANRIFEEKGNKFTEQNREKLSEILNPLKDKIADFEKKVEESSKESIRGNASLKEQLQMLKDLNQQVTQEAKNLTEALKGQSKTQGNWGEFILESLLEKSGLVKGREYSVQESITSESGRRFQPDVIIKLPDDKSLVIDSKVSLVGYEKFVSSESETDKQLALREHLNSIRSHIKNLNGKNYQNLYKLESLDFVLMFMPIEPAFALAVQNDPPLFSDAFEMNIVIVSPSTLLATLRTIASIWRQENQNKNALEIARQSGALYDKFVGFVDDLVIIGKKIDDSKNSYVDAMKKLTDGSGNLVRRAEKLKQLGAKASKNLPKSVLDRADGEDDIPLLDE
jgi:DNA recombination protein RmuC